MCTILGRKAQPGIDFYFSTHCVLQYKKDMKIIAKTIGRGEYAYLVSREGKRVVHRYIGKADSPKALFLSSFKTDAETVPERLKGLFWDTSLNNIQIKKNARYIMERVLEFGGLDALGWLQRVYRTEDIIDVLYLSRALSEKSRNFWLIWFGLEYAQEMPAR